MLVAALVLAFAAFVAFVIYIDTAATAALVLVFVAAGVGLVLFIADWWRKSRQDKAQDQGQPGGAS